MVKHLGGVLLKVEFRRVLSLGPMFFLIYINDVTDGLKCNVKLFVDDTSIFTGVHDPNTAAADMNHEPHQSLGAKMENVL